MAIKAIAQDFLVSWTMKSKKAQIILVDFLSISTMILLALLFLPYLKNDYWFDDALNSQVYWMIQKSDGDLFDFSWRVVKHWFLSAGRPMLIFFPVYSLFYFFHDLMALRAAHFLSVLINVVAWGVVLHRLNVARIFIFMWAIMFFGLFQVHARGLDPLAGFAFHYQILGLQLAILLLIFFRWKEKDGSVIGLGWVLLVWLLFMGFYEINVIFIPMVTVLILLEKNPAFNKKSMLMLVAGAALFYLIFYISLQKMAPETYAGAKADFGYKVFISYLKQLSATIPASAYFGSVQEGLPIKGLIDLAVKNHVSLVIFFLGAGSFLLSRMLLVGDLKITKQAFCLSLLMIFVPAIFPAISSRYQNEVGWGVGTLPVYYQWMGMSFLIVYGLFKLQSRFSNGVVTLFVSILFGMYLSLSYTSNVFIINSANVPYHDQREGFRLVAQQGIFGKVRNGDIIEINDCAHYVNSNLIYQYTNKRVYVPTDDYHWFPESPNNSAEKYKLLCSNGSFSLQAIE